MARHPTAHAKLAVLLLAAIAGTAASKAPIVIIPGLGGSDLEGLYSTAAAAAAAAGATDEPVVPVAAASAAEEAAAVIAAAGGAATPEQVEAAAVVLAECAKNQTTGGGGGGVGSSNVCPAANGASKLQVWPPLDPRFLLWQSCFYHIMKLNYNKATNMFSQNVDSNVVVREGNTSGTEYLIYKVAGYDNLTAYLNTTFGYTTGKDLFALPYDWRQDLVAMDQKIDAVSPKLLDRLAARIRRIVASNGGRKAVLITHSMGGIVALELLTKPRFAAWREANVRGFITLGTPFGGAVGTVAFRVGGYPYLLPDGIEGLFGDRIRDISYTAAMGMPSPVMLMPYAPAMLPASWVLVRTPARSYTVQQLPELLAAIGDEQAVSFYDQVHRLNGRLSTGPRLANITMWSIYGRNVSTPKTWTFPSNIQAGKRAANGSVSVWGGGDGTVNLESLRLCNRLTRRDRVIELDGDVSHSMVLTSPMAQAAIGRALRAILA